MYLGSLWRTWGTLGSWGFLGVLGGVGGSWGYLGVPIKYLKTRVTVPHPGGVNWASESRGLVNTKHAQFTC